MCLQFSYACHVPNIFLRYAWYRAKISLRYAYDMPRILLSYAWYSISWYMPDIYPRYLRFARKFHESCNKIGLRFACAVHMIWLILVPGLDHVTAQVALFQFSWASYENAPWHALTLPVSTSHNLSWPILTGPVIGQKSDIFSLGLFYWYHPFLLKKCGCLQKIRAHSMKIWQRY